MAEKQTKRLIRARSRKRATFTRRGVHQKKRLADVWRKPKGRHNKQRRKLKAKGPLPAAGYGSPGAVRGFHPSGYEEVRVFNAGGLAGLDPAVQVVRIAGAVGAKKREAIMATALTAGLKIVNPGMKSTEESTEEVEGNE
jgi:large subunit ribosomal protein L32e